MTMTVYYVKVWEKEWNSEGSYVRDRVYLDRAYITRGQAEEVASALSGYYDNFGVCGVYALEIAGPGGELPEADLKWADLKWADLSDANLRGST